MTNEDKDMRYHDWTREQKEMLPVIEKALLDERLRGLTALGFAGSTKIPNIADFNPEKAFLVCDAAQWLFHGKLLKPKAPVKTFNSVYNSQLLCSLFQQYFNYETKERVNSISYGELTLGMFMAGFKICRIPRSKFCKFNIDDADVKSLLDAILNYMKSYTDNYGRCGIAAALS